MIMDMFENVDRTLAIDNDDEKELQMMKTIALIQAISIRNVGNEPGTSSSFWRNKRLAKEVMSDWNTFRFLWLTYDMVFSDWTERKAYIDNLPKTTSHMINEKLAHVAWDVYHNSTEGDRNQIFGTEVEDKSKDSWSAYWNLSAQEKKDIFGIEA